MNDNLNFVQLVGCNLEKPAAKLVDSLALKGRFHVEHWRGGKLIGRYDVTNQITVAAKNKLLDAMFRGDTQITSWNMGLINNTPAPSTPETDTYASRSWTEFQGYSESARPAWSPAAAASKVSTNSTPVTFTVTGGSATVYGLFVCGGGTSPTVKGDTAGGSLLWAGAGFNSPVQVNTDDQLKVTYSVNS